MRELWINIAHTSGARIYTMAVGILTLSLTARLLGPEGRGQVAAIMTWVSMFSTFAYLSLGQVALHRMADRRERYGSLLGSLLFMAAILSVVSWLIAAGMYFASPEGEGAFKGLPGGLLMLGFVALPFYIWEQYGSSLLMGLEQIRIYNRFQVIGRTVSVIALFVLVGGLGIGVAGVLGASLLGQGIVALGGLGFLFSVARSRELSCKPDKEEIRALVSGGAKLHLNAIGAFLFTSANVLIINNYHGAAQTGQFQLATQLLSVLMIIPQAATMVIYGKVTSLGPNGAWPINRRVLMQLTAGMIALSVVAGLLAPWGVVLLAGEPFRPAATLFQWMLPGLVGMTFSTVMAPQWIGRGYFWQAATLTFLMGALNLAANFWLIPAHGMWGAIYAFLFTYTFSILSNGAMAFWCELQMRRQTVAAMKI